MGLLAGFAASALCEKFVSSLPEISCRCMAHEVKSLTSVIKGLLTLVLIPDLEMIILMCLWKNIYCTLIFR